MSLVVFSEQTSLVSGYTPLCEAVWSKSVDAASLLLKRGAKLTQSHYLLHYAVLHRHLSMAELLLKNGAYPNLREDHGDTPLLLAINCQDLVMVRLLLQYGTFTHLSLRSSQQYDQTSL